MSEPKSVLSPEQVEEFARELELTPLFKQDQPAMKWYGPIIQRIAAAGAEAELEAHECPECPICGDGAFVGLP